MGQGILKINLGAGNSPIEGWWNVDSREIPGIDQVVDLNILPWPWETGSVDFFTALDSLEHFYPLGKVEGQMNIVAILSEIHRCLKVGGCLYARIPSTESRGAFQDPTHVTFWNHHTWWYFDHRLDLSPPDWPKFETMVNEEDHPEQHLKWVLVKAVKVG